MKGLEEVLSDDRTTIADGFNLRGIDYRYRDGLLRQDKAVEGVQAKMADFYTEHWALPGAYDAEVSDEFQSELFGSFFGDYDRQVEGWLPNGGRVLDAGCGSGVAGRVFFRKVMPKIGYVGVDMSESVDQAAKEFVARGLSGSFAQCELNAIPFKRESFDVVFSVGVLHYTLDMRQAIQSLAGFVKPGGRFVAWVYKKQKPIRDLTDNYIRKELGKMRPDDAFKAMEPLTRLGIALGEVKSEITVPEDIPLLGIEAGTYDVQRFFYYYIMKLFYNPALPFTRHVVNNWNAYYPAHVLFLDPEQIFAYFEEAGLTIDYRSLSGNGLSIIARKR
jgi:arsenite methyltransferase